MAQQKEKKAEKDTIFIQIASYRDPQLLSTLKDIINNAAYPERLRFGIAWQHNPEDEWDNLNEHMADPRFKILNIDYRDSNGVCWARNLIQSLYANEKYTLQLDSHHRCIKNWDVELINMFNMLQQEGYKKPLLTAYLPSFDPANDPDSRILEPWKMTFDRFIPEGAIFFLPASFNTDIESIDKPLLGRFYSAHFGFTLGQFCCEVRHDPNYYFHGEEINVAVRAFTHGYDIFYPNKPIFWHEYTRKGRSKQWDDDSKWAERNNSCHLRNRQLFEMDGESRDHIDFGIYNFGNERTLSQYEKYAGISFKHRAITQQVIDHVPPDLNLINISDEEFESSLIFIFKHCIDIGYDQVPENDYDFWAVAFKDEHDNDMFRQDADINEIEQMKQDPDGYCKLWRQFETKEHPHSWVVWPHSISKGWMEPIVGKIK